MAPPLYNAIVKINSLPYQKTIGFCSGQVSTNSRQYFFKEDGMKKGWQNNH